jgi:microcystin synthetase protein McyA
LFDLSISARTAEPQAPGRHFLAWKDSRTGKHIPKEQMEEWADLTIQRILSLQPSEVLEIGCGNGLLLLNIAPLCRRYVGADVSVLSLQSARDQMTLMAGPWNTTVLREQPADDFAAFHANEFSTVVINSVIQYFPSLEYLTNVLNGAINVVHQGGAVFIGDVRNLALREDFAVFVELHKAGPELTIAEFRERVARRIAREPELLVHPDYFAQFARNNPKVSRVEISLKPGRADNELTRFRYDVTFHL